MLSLDVNSVILILDEYNLFIIIIFLAIRKVKYLKMFFNLII